MARATTRRTTDDTTDPRTPPVRVGAEVPSTAAERPAGAPFQPCGS